MARSETKWFCETCNKAYPEEKQAVSCEEFHYKVGQIIGVQYSHGKKCPTMIQVQIIIGDDLKDEELEAKLRELHETHPEFYVTVRRVMDGGRFFVTVEQEDEGKE